MSTSRHKRNSVAAAFAVALVFALGSPAANVVRSVVLVHNETMAAPASPADIDGYFPAIQLP